MLDVRGQFADEASAITPFQQIGITPTGIILQGMSAEYRLQTDSMGVLWRDNAIRTQLLDLFDRHFGNELVQSLQVMSIFIDDADERDFHTMTTAMYAGMNPPTFRRLTDAEFVDVGMMLDALIEDVRVIAQVGPMEHEQLLQMVYGVLKPDPDPLPEKAWFLGLTERDFTRVDPPLTVRNLRRTVGERLVNLQDFAEGFVVL